MKSTKKLKQLLVTTLFVCSTLFGIDASVVSADSVEGDVVVTLGRDLTQSQRTEILKEFGVDERVNKVETTVQDEFNYLGEALAKQEMGKRSLSSAKITLAKKGTGIVVTTKNVTMVTPDMYRNALATAGVKDAVIDVTAPSPVSGTAALTGIMKAYESKGYKIDNEVKQVANKEIIETAKLGDEVGKENANDLITSVKEEIATKMPKNEEAMNQLIQAEATKLNISLTDAQMKSLTDLFMQMKDANINWDSVKNTLEKAKDKLNAFAQSEEGKSFFESVKQVFISIWELITNVYHAIFG